MAESTGGRSFRAVLVLGTPVKEDSRGRVVSAVGLLHSNRGNVIVALGNREEADYMKQAALDCGLDSDELIVDGNSNTTLDNAYYAKKICQRWNLRPEVLITSQYQISRAAMTFRRVFGPECRFEPYPSPSLTSTLRRLRETVLRCFVPLLFLFRKGDDEGLKRASDLLGKLFFR